MSKTSKTVNVTTDSQKPTIGVSDKVEKDLEQLTKNYNRAVPVMMHNINYLQEKQLRLDETIMNLGNYINELENKLTIYKLVSSMLFVLAFSLIIAMKFLIGA